MGKFVLSLADYSPREEDIRVGENSVPRNSKLFRFSSSTPMRLASATRRLHLQSGLHCSSEWHLSMREFRARAFG